MKICVGKVLETSRKVKLGVICVAVDLDPFRLEPASEPAAETLCPEESRKALPFQHSTGVGLLADASRHPAVLQSHALQQPVVHIVPNPDGEDAELFLHGRASVSQDGGGLSLSYRRPAVRHKDDEGDAVGSGVGVRQVIPKQSRSGLDGSVNVCA